MSKTSVKATIGRLLPEKLRKAIENHLKGKSIEEVDIIYQIFKKENGKGKIMLDVGAHVGTALLPFAKKDWTIFAFEPDPTNRAKLVTNIADLSNVSIDTRAASNTSGETVSFFTSDVSTGISSMASFHESHKETAQVKTIKLADFCKEKHIQSVDFLKIDTEGFDLFVLQGFDWQNQQHPDYIVTEFEDRKTIPLGYTAAYNASKFGLVGFTQAVMLDLRQDNIKVTTIMPGSVSTHFNGNEPNDKDAWKIQPEDIGQMVVDLLQIDGRTLPSKIEVRPTMPPKK